MTRPMHPRVAEAWLQKMEPMMSYQRESLETIAGMRVEECGRVLTMEETGGRHKVRTTYRLVGEWQDKNE